MNYRDQRVVVMGLGVHGGGAGVARFLAERGARVTVTDLRPAEQLTPSLVALAPFDIRYVLGKHRAADFRAADLIIRNPGVPRESPYLRVAAAAGVPVVMEMTIFFQECPSTHIVGITGTKGKTTTTTLIGAFLQAHRLPHVVAGNLRVSALAALPQITSHTWVILELSSWQLEGLIPLCRSPHIAVITNIMPDHLDRYASFEDYACSKGLILRWQQPGDVAMLNRASPSVRKLGTQTAARVVWFDPDSTPPGWDTARLRGRHHRANAVAAATVAQEIGVPDTVITQVLADFSGLPHRQEIVRDFEGIRYINDSAATTPQATLAALAAMNRRVVLIAGGADKGLNFGDLQTAVQAPDSIVTAVVLLEGTATPKIAAACGPKVVGRFGNLAAAVAAARQVASPGQAVLLSPACASFGMFANEVERGDHFRSLVRALE